MFTIFKFFSVQFSDPSSDPHFVTFSPVRRCRANMLDRWSDESATKDDLNGTPVGHVSKTWGGQ